MKSKDFTGEPYDRLRDFGLIKKKQKSGPYHNPSPKTQKEMYQERFTKYKNQLGEPEKVDLGDKILYIWRTGVGNNEVRLTVPKSINLDESIEQPYKELKKTQPEIYSFFKKLGCQTSFNRYGEVDEYSTSSQHTIIVKWRPSIDKQALIRKLELEGIPYKERAGLLTGKIPNTDINFSVGWKGEPDNKEISWRFGVPHDRTIDEDIDHESIQNQLLDKFEYMAKRAQTVDELDAAFDNVKSDLKDLYQPNIGGDYEQVIKGLEIIYSDRWADLDDSWMD